MLIFDYGRITFILKGIKMQRIPISASEDTVDTIIWLEKLAEISGGFTFQNHSTVVVTEHKIMSETV
jgi:hypothetical protein